MSGKRIFVVSRIPLLLHSIANILGHSGGAFVLTGAVTAYSSNDDLALANSDAAIIHLCPKTSFQLANEFFHFLHREFGLKVIVMGDDTDPLVNELVLQDFVSGFIDHHVSPELFRRRVTEILELEDREVGMAVQDRRSPRLNVTIPVRLDGAEGTSRNISATGLYLQIDRKREYFVGEEVDFEIELELPSGESLMSSRGEVVRTEDLGDRLGVAIKILSTSVDTGGTRSWFPV